jgi:hypothetical protein
MTKTDNILLFKRLTLLLFFGLLLLNSANAQNSDSLFFDLSGRILSSDSLKPVYDAHIISKYNKWGTISDENGDFRMLVNPHDSILISSIGFVKRIFHITDSIRNLPQPVVFVLDIDTILIHEVVIHGFWDYRTFKQMVINMKPLDLSQFYPDMDADPLKYVEPTHALTVKGPIQALYDIFNKRTRLRRKLIKNREEYNRLMINLGREKDTIPSIPEHMQEKQH